MRHHTPLYTDHDESVRRVDRDALVAVCVAGRRQQPDAGEHVRLAVVLDVGRTREVDPFVWVMRPWQLESLDVDRHAGKQAVAAAVVEVKVGVDDAHDVSGDVLRHRHRRAFLVQLRCRVEHAGVDEDDAVGVLDRVRHGSPAPGDPQARPL